MAEEEAAARISAKFRTTRWSTRVSLSCVRPFRRACPLRSSPLRGMSPAPFPFRTDPHLAPRTLAQTIRRDSYGIPSMIVGNFIKL